jgi:hypothetical protein
MVAVVEWAALVVALDTTRQVADFPVKESKAKDLLVAEHPMEFLHTHLEVEVAELVALVQRLHLAQAALVELEFSQASMARPHTVLVEVAVEQTAERQLALVVLAAVEAAHTQQQ